MVFHSDIFEYLGIFFNQIPEGVIWSVLFSAHKEQKVTRLVFQIQTFETKISGNF